MSSLSLAEFKQRLENVKGGTSFGLGSCTNSVPQWSGIPQGTERGRWEWVGSEEAVKLTYTTLWNCLGFRWQVPL